jgi:uncharacterized protein YjbJ (UPF0337 family)
MNNDKLEGTLRTVTGDVKEFAGRAVGDRETQFSGKADKVAGEAQSAFGSAKDAIGTAASAAVEMTGFDVQTLREQIRRLTENVNKLVNEQASAATDTVTRVASATQDTLISMEDDLEHRIRRNPLTAIAIAVGVGALLASLFSPSRR